MALIYAIAKTAHRCEATFAGDHQCSTQSKKQHVRTASLSRLQRQLHLRNVEELDNGHHAAQYYDTNDVTHCSSQHFKLVVPVIHAGCFYITPIQEKFKS